MGVKVEGADTVGQFVVYDKSILELIDTDKETELLAEGFSWSEGPVWVEQLNCLLFSDIPNNKVLKYCPGEGLSDYLVDSGKANGLAINQRGELTLMRGAPRHVAVMDAALTDPRSKFRILADQLEGKKLNSPNDLTLTKAGGMYFTDPPYELKGGLSSPQKELPFQGVFFLNSDRELEVFDEEISWPNGVALSENEEYLFLAVSDPDQPVWYRYALDEKGKAMEKKLLFDARNASIEDYTHGLPDGMKMHSSGKLFATGPGGVWVFDQQGKLLARLLIPKRPVANLAFDSEERFMYLTADDQLLRIALK